MKFKIKKDEFLKGLSRIQSVADKRNTMPILSNVLIESVEGGISLTATDLEIGLRGIYAAEVEETGGITLSAKKLFEIVRELPHEDVLFETTENNWATIKSGKAVFKFTGLPREEFPSLPTMDEAVFMEIDGHSMRDLIKKTIFAAGDNDTRYVLNGIYMTVAPIEGGISIQMVGTDGHRLAVIKSVFDGIQGVEASAIIPKKSANELKKLLEEDEGALQMAMSKNHIVFKIDTLYMVTRLIEGNYPNYEQVIPASNNVLISIDKSALSSALKRVSLLSRERTNAVKFAFADNVAILSSQNPEMGEAREDIPVEYTGESIEVGFNAKYIIEALNVMEHEAVELQLKDSLSPCIIHTSSDGYRCVVMPMRV